MLRLLICFSLVAGACGCATVTGAVSVSGSNKHSYNDIVVWLQPAGSSLPGGLPAADDLPHRTLLQKDKTFRPHILPIRAGTVVDFPNADPIFHNAFSNYDGQLFDVSLYPPGSSRSVLFRQPGVVRVFCNIHPMMSAVILVLDTPYFARIDNDGRFRLKSVVPGNYELHFFDERATHSTNASPLITVPAGEDTVAAPTLAVSEAGYAPAPHKNKYGRDYPSAADTYSDIPK